MTPLRQKMIDAMRQRGFSSRTHESYLGSVASFARFHRRALEDADADDVARYFEYLVGERAASASTCRVHLGAVRFLYEKVLDQPALIRKVVLPKRGQRLPGLLSAGEVRALISATANVKHRCLLCTCYGCGLRVSELVGLRVRNIDGERRVLRVEQGKGNKDRDVALSETSLAQLRHYWSQYRTRGLAVSERAYGQAAEREHAAEGVQPMQGRGGHREAWWDPRPSARLRNTSARGRHAGSPAAARPRACQSGVDDALRALGVGSSGGLEHDGGSDW